MPRIDPISAREADVIASRDALAATIDQLSDAVNPRIQAVAAAHRARDLWDEAIHPAADAAPEQVKRSRAVIAGAAAAAVATVTLAMVKAARRR